tara:strand:+ start:876 stop:1586 length:711 start_codon:yes stop_codon:yes gene_type:complete
MKGFYINLQKRKDRKDHFENLKKKFKFLKDIERSEGCTFINNEYINKFVKGSAGCAQAHLNCLKKLKKLEGEYFAIFEDDFLILDDNVFNEFINEFDKIKDSNMWDVILLMPRGYTDKKYYLNNFHRMKISRSAPGYIFKKHLIDILIEVFSYSVENLKKYFKIPYSKEQRLIVGEFALDRVWSKLFNNYNFIYYYKIFGHQLDSYSDIENTEVKYSFYMEGKYYKDINLINDIIK